VIAFFSSEVRSPSSGEGSGYVLASTFFAYFFQAVLGGLLDVLRLDFLS